MTTDTNAAQLLADYDRTCNTHNNAAGELIQTLANNLSQIARNAIARVEALEAELAEARAELDEFEPIDDEEVAIHAQQVLDELQLRGLHTHPNDAPVTATTAWDALQTVLAGVEAVVGRAGDVGGPVEVPAGLVPDAEGWYPHDGTAWPPCAPGDEVDYCLRDGDVNRDIVGMLRWGHNGDLGDIIAWRPVREGGPDKRDI